MRVRDTINRSINSYLGSSTDSTTMIPAVLRSLIRENFADFSANARSTTLQSQPRAWPASNTKISRQQAQREPDEKCAESARLIYDLGNWFAGFELARSLANCFLTQTRRVSRRQGVQSRRPWPPNSRIFQISLDTRNFPRISRMSGISPGREWWTAPRVPGFCFAKYVLPPPSYVSRWSLLSLSLSLSLSFCGWIPSGWSLSRAFREFPSSFAFAFLSLRFGQ